MSRAPLLAALLLATPIAAHAAGPFDGTYRGSQTTIRTNNSTTCAHMDRSNVVIHVRDNAFSRKWGSGKYGGDEIAVTVGADGSFSNRVVSSVQQGRGRSQSYYMKGRIAGGVLDAEIGSDLCAVRMTLHKS